MLELLKAFATAMDSAKVTHQAYAKFDERAGIHYGEKELDPQPRVANNMLHFRLIGTIATLLVLSGCSQFSPTSAAQRGIEGAWVHETYGTSCVLSTEDATIGSVSVGYSFAADGSGSVDVRLFHDSVCTTFVGLAQQRMSWQNSGLASDSEGILLALTFPGSTTLSTSSTDVANEWGAKAKCGVSAWSTNTAVSFSLNQSCLVTSTVNVYNNVRTVTQTFKILRDDDTIMLVGAGDPVSYYPNELFRRKN